MFEVSEVRAAFDTLQKQVAQLDPALFRGDDAAKLMGEFTKAKNLCATAEAMLAERATETGAHKRSGTSNPNAWIASQTGLPYNAARSALNTAKAAKKLPKTRSAMRKGKLSLSKASSITRVAALNPKLEDGLLKAAETSSADELDRRARRIEENSKRTAGKARMAKLHENRYARLFNRADGSVGLDGSFAPEMGADIKAILEAEARKIKKASSVTFDQAMADAVHKVVTSGGGKVVRNVNVIVDHGALVRGETQDEETCEIAGVGPVPVSTVEMMLADAFLKVLVSDKGQVTRAVHVGRPIPAAVKSAVLARSGGCCERPGCSIDWGLEHDHRVVGYAQNGPPTPENIVLLCGPDHRMKTYLGWNLVGEPGNWKWVGPDEPNAP